MVAALLEGGIAFATSRGLLPPEIAGPVAKVCVLVFAGYGLSQNLHLRSLWFVMLGLLCNSIVIIANGGHMPVSGPALEKLGMQEFLEPLRQKSDAVHSLMAPDTAFWYLGDVIPVQLLSYTNVISLGDVYLMVGIMLTVLDGALAAKADREKGLEIDISI